MTSITLNITQAVSDKIIIPNSIKWGDKPNTSIGAGESRNLSDVAWPYTYQYYYASDPNKIPHDQPGSVKPSNGVNVESRGTTEGPTRHWTMRYSVTIDDNNKLSSTLRFTQEANIATHNITWNPDIYPDINVGQIVTKTISLLTKITDDISYTSGQSGQVTVVPDIDWNPEDGKTPTDKWSYALDPGIGYTLNIAGSYSDSVYKVPVILSYQNETRNFNINIDPYFVKFKVIYDNPANTESKYTIQSITSNRIVLTTTSNPITLTGEPNEDFNEWYTIPNNTIYNDQQTIYSPVIYPVDSGASVYNADGTRTWAPQGTTIYMAFYNKSDMTIYPIQYTNNSYVSMVVNYTSMPDVYLNFSMSKIVYILVPDKDINVDTGDSDTSVIGELKKILFFDIDGIRYGYDSQIKFDGYYPFKSTMSILKKKITITGINKKNNSDQPGADFFYRWSYSTNKPLDITTINGIPCVIFKMQAYKDISYTITVNTKSNKYFWTPQTQKQIFKNMQATSTLDSYNFEANNHNLLYRFTLVAALYTVEDSSSDNKINMVSITSNNNADSGILNAGYGQIINIGGFYNQDGKYTIYSYPQSAIKIRNMNQIITNEGNLEFGNEGRIKLTIGTTETEEGQYILANSPEVDILNSDYGICKYTVSATKNTFSYRNIQYNHGVVAYDEHFSTVLVGNGKKLYILKLNKITDPDSGLITYKYIAPENGKHSVTVPDNGNFSIIYGEDL